MATTKPFAYNIGPLISGTTQVGDLAVGNINVDYSANYGGVEWWMGPDEDLGYVIAHPVPSNTQPTQIPGTFASLGFDRTKDFLDSSFINLAEYVTRKYSTPQTFSSATDASIWLTNNGFWNSYITPLLYLDAGNPLSYSGTGTIWTDLVGGKQFTLYNSPTYSSSNGGYLSFDSGLQQYGETTTSLPNLSTWSVGVWHYYTGTNIGDGMCIVTEVYPGTTGHINYSLGDNQGSGFSSGFFDISAWRTSGVDRFRGPSYSSPCWKWKSTEESAMVKLCSFGSSLHVPVRATCSSCWETWQLEAMHISTTMHSTVWIHWTLWYPILGAKLR